MRSLLFIVVAAVLVIGPVVARRYRWDEIEPPSFGCAVALEVCVSIQMAETSWMPGDVRPVEVDVADSSTPDTWRVTVHAFQSGPVEGTCWFVSGTVQCQFPGSGS